MKHLDVWKGQQMVGSLTPGRAGLRFRFEPAFVERVGLGRPIVSMSLPTSLRPIADRTARPFFDGLLPEGDARRIIAYDFGVDVADTFGLLAAIGRDCAGALAVLAAGEGPAAQRPAGTPAELGRATIDSLVANLRVHPLGVDQSMRASLGGVQEKLLLTQRADQSWALPSPGVASTHLMKPAVAGLPDIVANEAVCLRFAALAGARAAVASVDRFGGRDVLVVERFDRCRTTTGHIARMHQETACQALAVPVAAVARKYEGAGGPSLRTIAALLTRWSTEDQLEELLRHTMINVLVGNADAHAMNLSFVLADDGAVRVAPMYDVFATVAYPHLTVTPGMFIDDVRDIRATTRANVEREASTWGLDPRRAAAVIDDVCTAAPAAMARAVAEVSEVPDALAQLLVDRVDAVARSA